MFPQLHFHGAVTGVTGSCHELQYAEDASVLIDCGLFQGEDRRDHAIDFSIEHVKALVVTHVHIDHVGRIPYLLAAGFDGPIYCSEPSAILLPLVLEDAVKIGFTRDRKLVERFIKRIEKQIIPVPYGQWRGIGNGVRIRMKPAGHVFGSVYVEFDCGQERIVYSGDLGAPYAPLLPSPKSPHRADRLILESTYGDRRHEMRRERRRLLKEVILNAFKNRGVILIPAFSIGRTQELLYEIEDMIYRLRHSSVAPGVEWDDLEVIVDSPLANRFTDVFRQLRKYWDAEARERIREGRHPLSFDQLTTIDSHAEHKQMVKALKKSARPCIVIAASGMCTGGRIVNYLKSLIGDSRTDIVFVGYQGWGTPGRDIQKYGPSQGYVRFGDQRYNIRAGVYTIGGYSAHADQQNLIDFVRRIKQKPREIYLVHGDSQAKAALQKKLLELEGIDKVIIATGDGG